ncbi:MAG: NTP transferase domain-containing protein, partial [Actinobacteria bacterium]|nr:NTP transferase domain-containing protein [Actinomycetota bacterium]
MTDPWVALVLAGGASRRLGGVDKPLLTVGGSTLLERAVTA